MYGHRPILGIPNMLKTTNYFSNILISVFVIFMVKYCILNVLRGRGSFFSEAFCCFKIP